MVQVHFDQVSKLYPDGTKAVDSLDLHVRDGELLCVLGPSGCGKSSTIRMLAGLEDVSAGVIRIDQRRINDVPPQERDAAMVFENYALYPHLTSFENIAMPLRARGRSRADVQRLVAEVATLLRIGELLERKPGQLSGGQRQRVAIGRAIVRSPQLFLMDEPLGHLEAYLRVELRAEIRALQERLGVTTLYVTHDQEEAAALADSVAIMSNARLQQVGTFLDVLEKPANLFVASFIGEPPMNLLPVAGLGEAGAIVLGRTVPVEDRVIRALAGRRQTPTTCGVRPQDLILCPVEEGDIAGSVVLVQPQGRSSIVLVDIGEGRTLTVQTTREASAGMPVGLRIDRSKIHLFDEAGVALAHGAEVALG
jgi:ABC-type sugar transport system ATPase subunit